MKKKKQGFTLIELLAVIVILAIIMVITTPIILKSIEDARKGAFQNSIYGIIKAGEFNYSRRLLKNEENRNMEYIYENEKEFSPTNDDKLDYKGSKPYGGIIKINKKGEIALALHNKKWCALKKDYETEINWIEYTSDEDCQLEEDDYVLATDEDFEWIVDESNTHYWHYIGQDEYVEIPQLINGMQIFTYYKMFEGNTNIKGVKSNNPLVERAGFMFENGGAKELDLTQFNTEYFTNMSCMFQNSQSKRISICNFNTSNVTDMSQMFLSSQFTSLNLSSFDTSKVTDMRMMFYNSQAITLDLSGFNTQNVTGMSSMFSYSQATELDLSSFDTSKVITMSHMFRGNNASTLNLSSFDTSNVTDMERMFHVCKATTGYARTQADADRFNAEETERPNPLTFIVK